MGATLQIDGVTKSFGSKTVLDTVSITANDGEFVALVGPSGCGKSTVLRVTAGLESPDRGSILIGGREVTQVSPRDRNVAMVFQDYALYPHMTVFENIAFGLKMRGMDRATTKKKVQEAAEKLGLGEFLERRPASLSGGQRQRVAIGRALVRSPALFLFDEPLSNLDAKLRGSMRVMIARFHAELKATSLYVTHDQVEAMTMADRIVIMDQGRIRQTGTPLEIYNEPKDVFVASFIGSPPMNILNGRVNADAHEMFFKGPGGLRLLLPEALAAKLRQRGDSGGVSWGVRAEQLTLAPAAAPGSVPARVILAESLGPDSTIYCDLGGEELYVKVHGQRHPERGETVHLSFDRSSPLHLFDQTTGASLVN